MMKNKKFSIAVIDKDKNLYILWNLTNEIIGFDIGWLEEFNLFENMLLNYIDQRLNFDHREEYQWEIIKSVHELHALFEK
jgi:hypothetical protein